MNTLNLTQRRKDAETRKRLLLFLLCAFAALRLCVSPAPAATRIEATVTIWTNPAAGDIFQINDQARRWTNGTLASTNWIQVSNSPAAATTNLYAHALANPFTNVVDVTWLTSTSLLFTANYDLALAVPISGACACLASCGGWVFWPSVSPSPSWSSAGDTLEAAASPRKWSVTELSIAMIRVALRLLANVATLASS